MSVISIRGMAACLLALSMLALPHPVRDSGSAISRSDAPFADATPQKVKALRPQLLAVAKDERQRLPGGPASLAPPRTADLRAGRSATPSSRLSRLALGYWPRVGHERDPPTA
jgi:hypothetical protein